MDDKEKAYNLGRFIEQRIMEAWKVNNHMLALELSAIKGYVEGLFDIDIDKLKNCEVK